MLVELLRVLFDWRTHKFDGTTIIFMGCILKVPFDDLIKGTLIQQIVCREQTLFLYVDGTHRVFPISIAVGKEVFL
jgi:hypothetical protein